MAPKPSKRVSPLYTAARCATALNRREWLAGILPLCCATPGITPDSVHIEGSTLVIDLDRAPELRAVGSARAILDSDRKLNLIVVRVDKRRFVALDRACTHNGASCTYNRERKTLQCTSLNHAEYDLAGTLLHGRTHGNLRVYKVGRIGSRLEIPLEQDA